MRIEKNDRMAFTALTHAIALICGVGGATAFPGAPWGMICAVVLGMVTVFGIGMYTRGGDD